MNFTPIDPIKALFWSAVINGVAAAPIMAMMMLMTMRRDVMGEFTLPRGLLVIGWLATGVMGADDRRVDRDHFVRTTPSFLHGAARSSARGTFACHYPLTDLYRSEAPAPRMEV